MMHRDGRASGRENRLQDYPLLCNNIRYVLDDTIGFAGPLTGFEVVWFSRRDYAYSYKTPHKDSISLQQPGTSLLMLETIPCSQASYPAIGTAFGCYADLYKRCYE